jgi:hypothetical protein
VTAELRDDCLDDPRVATIDEPIREPAAPPELDNGLDAEGGADAAKPLDRDARELPSFE